MGALLLCRTTLFIIISLLSLLSEDHHVVGAAEVYTVGDGDGWSTGINYLSWSQKYNFTAGDVLAFSYVKDQHDACEVTEETFRSCDSSAGGVIKKYEGGKNRVLLAEARSYWFICDIPGHCLVGMKFGIRVNAADKTRGESTVTSGPKTPPSATVVPEAAAGGGAARTGRWRCFYLVVIGLLHLCF